MDRLGHETRRLFQSLHRRWLPEPDLTDGFLNSLDGYASLQAQLRSDKELRNLSRQMYSDLYSVCTDASAAQSPPNESAGIDGLTEPVIHELLQIVQMMELAWMQSQLDDYDSHPLNRGWVAAFHRWSMMPAFRRAWPVLRADFSRSFINYLQSRYSLSVNYEYWGPSSKNDSIPERVREVLQTEFVTEWPEIDPAFLKTGNLKRCSVSYVYPVTRKSSDSGSQSWELKDIPMGFVALLPSRAESSRSRATGGDGLRSCDDNAPELRFWVRPQYRFLGIGRELLERFAIAALSGKPPAGNQTTRVKRSSTGRSWDDESPLVTRYFVRTGQVSGHGLRRRMQLGFLYEYGFARHDDRPYDECVSQRPGEEPHPSERGIDRQKSVNPQETIVPTILRTTWHEFFESVRAMSAAPGRFDGFRRVPVSQS